MPGPWEERVCYLVMGAVGGGSGGGSQVKVSRSKEVQDRGAGPAHPQAKPVVKASLCMSQKPGKFSPGSGERVQFVHPGDFYGSRAQRWCS